MSQVRPVEIPKYDELSVVNLITDVMKQPDFAKFFPEQKTKANLPDRVYFFNILNTTDPGMLTPYFSMRRGSVSADRPRMQRRIIMR